MKKNHLGYHELISFKILHKFDRITSHVFFAGVRVCLPDVYPSSNQYRPAPQLNNMLPPRTLPHTLQKICFHFQPENRHHTADGPLQAKPRDKRPPPISPKPGRSGQAWRWWESPSVWPSAGCRLASCRSHFSGGRARGTAICLGCWHIGASVRREDTQTPPHPPPNVIRQGAGVCPKCCIIIPVHLQKPSQP